MGRLLRLLRPYRALLALTLLLALLQSIANLALPTLMADIVDNGIIKGDNGYIIRVGVVMLLVTIGGAICAIVGRFLSARISIGFGRILRAKLFTHVQSFSLEAFDNLSTASLITRTTNDTTQVQMVVTMALGMVITAPMMAIGGVILALSQDRELSWILLVAMPVVFLVFLVTLRKAVPLFQAMQVKLDKLNLVMDEGLTGVRVVRAFDRDAHEQRRFDIANLDLTDTAITVNQIVAVLMPAMMLIMNLASIAILWFGSIRVNDGSMQIGSMIAFLQYVVQILFSIMMVAMLFVMLPRAAASATRINEVLDVVPDIEDPDAPLPSGPARGYLEFQDVTFRYPGAEEPALSHVSFKAGPGEVTAIIGGTGSGKSTLVSLIPRFYDVETGRILVDGYDVRDLAQADLRAKIGFVPQRAVLFTGTIMANLRYGKSDATTEEVLHALEVAQGADFVAAMPDGPESLIAQGGTNVSGGQKQRLSIARALTRKPEIYVFDDAFSALDFATDARLRAALKREIRDATVVIVAQRVGTVMDADRIIVLDNGQVAGVGTHHELLDTCEVYREIVSSQLAQEEIA